MKKYSKPEMKVILLQHKSQLLAGSDPTMLMNRRAYKDDEMTYEADQL